MSTQKKERGKGCSAEQVTRKVTEKGTPNEALLTKFGL